MPSDIRWRWLGWLLAVPAAAAGFAFIPSADASPVRLEPCVVQGLKARCGTVRVLENRARPGSRKIELNVVVIPARTRPASRDAFTYLAGGPGGAATQSAFWVASAFSGLNRTRDILLVDQRGTGWSNALTCDQPAKPLRNEREMAAYVRACLRSLPGDVRQYGTRAAADDLEAVRKALGYRRLDLYGASYGATAAQLFLKRHPGSVRTMVLDGATAIDVPFYARFAANASAALDDVAARCDADTRCSAAFPGWREQLSSMIAAWDARPVESRKGVRTTGAGLAGVVQQMLLDVGKAASIPLLVHRSAVGDYRLLNTQIGSGGASPQPMFWSIWCNEPWVGLGARGPWGTDFDSATTAGIAYYRTVCRYIPRRAEPASLWRPSRSTVPVLALAGGADPQDPITNLPDLSERYPSSRAIVVPHYGHTVAQYGCLGDLVSRFVTEATARRLDTACVAEITPPRFGLTLEG